MSHDKPEDPETIHEAIAPDTVEPSRRDVLHLLSAAGLVAVAVPVTASASPSWVALPHADIVERAMLEPAYRSQLIAHPKQTLAQQHGITLGAGISLTVVVDTMEEVHVVLCSHAGMRGPETGIVSDILETYRSDPAFRQQLLQQPRAAFEDWTGATIPEALDIVVVQENPTHRVIQLPVQEMLGVDSGEAAMGLWGGDDWTGGGGDPWTTGTYESGQACNCFTEELASVVTNCCFEPPETETPGG